MNKGLAKHCFEFYGIKTPRGVTIKKEDDTHSILLPFFREVSGWHVVKPITGGSSVGVVLTRSFDELCRVIDILLETYRAVLVEEFIRGREMTCGVVDGLNGSTYPLLPIEIIKKSEEHIWDYDSKYNGDTEQHVCPANLDEKRFREVQQIAVSAHRHIGLRHYSRADLIVSPDGIYLLEVNSLPGLTEHSLLPRSLNAAGLEFHEFLDYLVTLALRK
jgi:D-alanine-D-alanine ligase